LVSGGGSGKHHGDHQAVSNHHGRPHVEIEAPIILVPRLDERRLQRIEAGDATQAQIDGGQPGEVVVTARRQRGETARRDAKTCESGRSRQSGK